MMKKTNLYLINIGNVSATSGVDRYLETLVEGIKNIQEFYLFKIELIRDTSLLFPIRKEKEGYTEMIIPFPVEYKEIIDVRYWIRKYNQQVFHLIEDLFRKDTFSILHIHTLNLIDLAIYIKEQVPMCKIITHLHCIPWKSSFNSNKKKFNGMYFDSYLSKEKIFKKEFYLTNNCEFDSYTQSDKIITVTHCARKFLIETMEISPDKIQEISNGLSDRNNYSDIYKSAKKKSDLFNFLYVGVLSESKGIFYILESLEKVRSLGYRIHLNIAGACSLVMRKKIEDNFSDLSFNLLGRLPFEELKNYYLSCDMGLIASLQEQCSYVAIEMAMFGLPVITTAVDGLDEMFTDRENALKVNTVFSKVLGLRLNTDLFAQQIITLIENESLRNYLGNNARKLYEENFTSQQMIEKTTTLYKELAYE